VFTVEERDRVRDLILAMARGDERVVAGAVLGSLAHGPGDAWSDLDLGFGIAHGVSPEDVLADWTRTLERDHSAVQLFDVSAHAAVYRVFLFPGCLQVDISVTPASEFAARTPTFRLLFGEAVVRPHVEPPSARHLFGLGVHHAVRARVCIERARHWQAAYWIGELRTESLSLACRQRGLPATYARGHDDLPPEVLGPFQSTFVRTIERTELERALGASIDAFLSAAGEVGEELGPAPLADIRQLGSARLGSS